MSNCLLCWQAVGDDKTPASLHDNGAVVLGYVHRRCLEGHQDDQADTYIEAESPARGLPRRSPTWA